MGCLNLNTYIKAYVTESAQHIFPFLEPVLALLIYTKPVTLALKFSYEEYLFWTKEPLNSVPMERGTGYSNSFANMMS